MSLYPKRQGILKQLLSFSSNADCAPQLKTIVGHRLNFRMNLLRHPRHFYLRRTIILGAAVFVVTLIAGIALIFWRQYPNDLPKMPSSMASRLLLQAVVGPIYMGVAFLWPITLPVMFVLVIMTYLGSQLRRIWLSLAAFLLMGLYWLWMVELIADGAFD